MSNYDTICTKCGGLIGRPGKVYGWGGDWCCCQKDDVSIKYEPIMPQGKSQICPVCNGCGVYPPAEEKQNQCHGCAGKGWIVVY